MTLVVKSSVILAAVLGLATLALAPPAIRADEQCDHGMIAVALVSGTDPGGELKIERLAVSRVEVRAAPSEEDLRNAARAVLAVDPTQTGCSLQDTLGNFVLCTSAPHDFGGSATILDRRTAGVLFSGTVVWNGTGHVLVPKEDTAKWWIVSGDPAPPPQELDVWGDHSGTAVAALSYVRQTDLLHTIANRGGYSVAAYYYTPRVGLVDPRLAREVLIISWCPR